MSRDEATTSFERSSSGGGLGALRRMAAKVWGGLAKEAAEQVKATGRFSVPGFAGIPARLRRMTIGATLRGFGAEWLDWDAGVLLGARAAQPKPDAESVRTLTSLGVEHLEVHRDWRAELTKGSVVYVQRPRCRRWVRATVVSARDENVSVSYREHHSSRQTVCSVLPRSSARLRFVCAAPAAARPQAGPSGHEEACAIEEREAASLGLLGRLRLQTPLAGVYKGSYRGADLDKHGNPIHGKCLELWEEASRGASAKGSNYGMQLDKYSSDICGACLVLLAGVYNGAAVKGEYGGVQLDRHGNAAGGGYDLAADGSFVGYKVLVGNFFESNFERLGLEQLVMPELAKKGFAVHICRDVGSFVSELRSGRYHVAWIISGQQWTRGDQGSFLSAVRDFHQKGHGLMIWGDNAPYFHHASLVLRSLFGFGLTGNTPGGKFMRPGLPTRLGCFDKGHKVCAGLSALHEGVTICHPDWHGAASGWEVFGTSSDGKPALFAKDAQPEVSCPGRVMVDCGFTKLMEQLWDTAGTPRYVSNCTAWLALRERFRTPS